MALPERRAAPPAISGRLQAARLATRLTVAFALDTIAIARGDRHVLDTLLLSTITQANVAPISQQGDLQVAYSGADEAPPDELRRPISINAVAASLGLPFETVRRRVKGLVEQGLCVQRDGGVVVPAAVVSSPEYLKNGFAAYERIRAFYYELRDLGLVGLLPPPTVKMEPAAFPLRTVARLLSDYLLRIIDTLMRYQGDALNVLVLLEIFRSNTERFSPEMAGGEGMDPADMIPDKYRKPIRTSVLARRLGLPQETVRRHVESLMEKGLVRRVAGGLIIPSEVLAQPRMRAGLAENVANLQRLFGGLSQLGVLAIWDQLNPPTAAGVTAAVAATAS